MTFQDTWDPSPDVVLIFIVTPIEHDLTHVDGPVVHEPGEAEAKQSVHESTALLHKHALAGRDEQVSRTHGLLRRQERQDLRLDLRRKLAEAVGWVDHTRSRREGFLPASRQRRHGSDSGHRRGVVALPADLPWSGTNDD